MPASLDFLLGLREHEDPAYLAREDFDGAHGKGLRLWRKMGFIEKDPGMNPVPGCPHCGEGEPYRLGGRYVCAACRSTGPPDDLLLWRVDPAAFLRWLSGKWRLTGGVRPVDPSLWQLGTRASEAGITECFYVRRGPLAEPARQRILAYRSALVLYGLTRPPAEDAGDASLVSLLDVLRIDRTLSVAAWPGHVSRTRQVRLGTGTGALWAGGELLGEVPVGSKEHAFLVCLATEIDRFVPYADLKKAVLQQTGSTDTTEEATFCQGLKSRIKKKWIPAIDRLIVTTNKGDGYRLRGQVEPSDRSTSGLRHRKG